MLKNTSLPGVVANLPGVVANLPAVVANLPAVVANQGGFLISTVRSLRQNYQRREASYGVDSLRQASIPLISRMAYNVRV